MVSNFTNCCFLSTDAALPFSGFEGSKICMNFEQNITKFDSTITIKNKEMLPVFTFIQKDRGWNLNIGQQYENRIQTSEKPTSNLEFCFLNTTKDDAGSYFSQDENITLNVWCKLNIYICIYVCLNKNIWY